LPSTRRRAFPPPPRPSADYAGVESYVRFYLPENYQLVYAVLGLYVGIGLYMSSRSKSSAAKALREQTEPEKPDYHTRECARLPRLAQLAHAARGSPLRFAAPRPPQR